MKALVVHPKSMLLDNVTKMEVTAKTVRRHWKTLRIMLDEVCNPWDPDCMVYKPIDECRKLDEHF